MGQTSSDVETLESQTDVSEAMDTTPLNTEGPTHAHSSVSELWSVSNESIPRAVAAYSAGQAGTRPMLCGSLSLKYL